MPAGLRVYAIGDIHGRRDLLDELLAMIDADHAARGAAERHLIFLGDYVDRGADSAGVIARLIALKAAEPNLRFLGGNHEEVMIRALEGDAMAARLFLRIGGADTVVSYGYPPTEEGIAELAARFPPEHLTFLATLEDRIVFGDYAFVHAGIKPGRLLEHQTLADLRWIRDEFLRSDAIHQQIVVHGHTITDAVEDRHNRIGIDTGAFATGRLTALGLEAGERWFLATGAEVGVATE